MKNSLLYILTLLSALLVPVERTDVGQLQPVDVIYLCRDENTIVIETDTRDLGRGKTIEEAFENLERTTAGIVFLDTADFVLVSEEAIDLTDTLAEYVKSSVRVCLAGGGIDLAEVSPYLNVHPPRVKLKDMEEVSITEILCVINGRLILTEKVKNSA